MKIHAKSLIIAEAGVDHNGQPHLAKKLVDAAVFAGADIVKFRLFKQRSLLLLSLSKLLISRVSCQCRQPAFYVGEASTYSSASP